MVKIKSVIIWTLAQEGSILMTPVSSWKGLEYIEKKCQTYSGRHSLNGSNFFGRRVISYQSD